MLEHRQATDGRNPFCVRHSRSQLSGYAVLHFTFLRAEVVKVPRLVAPTGESKLSSTSHGHKLLALALTLAWLGLALLHDSKDGTPLSLLATQRLSAWGKPERTRAVLWGVGLTW